MHETLDETLSALDDLINDTYDWMIRRGDYYFDLKSNEELTARLNDIEERLIEYGDATVEPLKEYLHDTETHAHIVAAAVLQEIGTPAAIRQLIDALESADSKLCEYVSEVLKSVGTPVIPQLTEKITYRLDNTAVDENGNIIDIIYPLGVLSAIRDPQSFDFMVGLLDRFDDGVGSLNLAYLCSRIYHQHNREIIPRLEAIAEKYGAGTPGNVALEANSTIQRMLVDRILESEDWMIYGCCYICEDYDKHEKTCTASGEHKPYDSFCIQCIPEKEFSCELCYLKRFVTSPDDPYRDGCDIDNLPPIYVNLEYSHNQGGVIEEFEITTSYRNKGLITVESDSMELSFEFHTVDDLNVLKEFFEGAGDPPADGMRFFIDTEEIFDESYPEAVDADGELIRRDDGNIVAVHKEDQFELELVLSPDTIENLIAIIDTQRFILLCDTHTYIDDFRERQDKMESDLRQVMRLGEPAEDSEYSKEPEPEGAPPSPPCNHEFELLKTHKKYSVYRCTKCGETKKKFA